MYYENTKTFQDLAKAIREQIESSRIKTFDGSCRITPGGTPIPYELPDSTDARLAFIRLKAEQGRNDLSDRTPTDLIDLLSLCESAGNGHRVKNANHTIGDVRTAIKFMKDEKHPEYTEQELLNHINKTTMSPDGRPYKTMTPDGLRKHIQRIKEADEKSS